jgi:hypothetical protein
VSRSCGCSMMGYSSHLFVETNAFVLLAKVGCSVLRIVEKSRGNSCAAHLGKVSMA